MAPSDPILCLKGVRTWFGKRHFLTRASAPIRAVDGVDLELRRGEILGLVGESGSGKSTLGRTILGIQRETSGEIRLHGLLVSGLTPRDARFARRSIQYVHQDPGAALDPWWSIGRTLTEGMGAHGIRSASEQSERIQTILDAVGMPQDCLQRYPHELSGGQLRRIGIARILVLAPEIVVFDEPTSGLDLSVQAMVLRLILDIRKRLDLTYILISHDLSLVERICDRVANMYFGKVVEMGDARELFSKPRHPYTRVLIDASPSLEPGQLERGLTLRGDPPSPTEIPPGCAFSTRCPEARAHCPEQVPMLEDTGAGHMVSCLRWRELHMVRPAPDYANVASS
jgi:oligopeptide/dipeptide ABC transporter ATP-binding protein